MTASIHHLHPVDNTLAVERAHTILSYADDLPMIDVTLEAIPAEDLPELVRAMAQYAAELFDLAAARGVDLWTEVCA